MVELLSFYAYTFDVIKKINPALALRCDSINSV